MRRFASPGQRGYSLIELSVAIVIALFLLAGLFSILQSTRKTSNDQTLLSQLQDNERIAMTLLSETIQTAGYYYDPLNESATTAFAAASPYTVAGQSITGTFGPDPNYPNAIGDSITVRYQSDGTGSILGCLGTSDSTAGALHSYELFVQYDDASQTTSSLYCSMDGKTPAALVPNVSNMKITYGVDTTGSGTGINAYIPAAGDHDLSGMTGNWLNVYSITIQLSFPNPLLNVTGESNTGQTNAPPITFTRVINLMARTGTNSAAFNN
jgi:type IV pilus assembly protein PilW